MIELETELIDKLSAAGILAYMAVSLAGDAENTTAVLAGRVKARTNVMLEGLKELAVVAPELVSLVPKSRTWRCGVVKSGNGEVLQNSESSERYRVFVDDIKKYWDYLNPSLDFSMNGKDGAQFMLFLKDHPKWTQTEWLTALRNRAISVIKFKHASRTQPHWVWIGRLADYFDGPLNEYNKPVGGGQIGKAIGVEDANREARAAALNGVRGRAQS